MGKKMKCCLWGTVAALSSSIIPLYGGDDDDDPAPIARKTFEDIEAAFGERHSRFLDLQHKVFDDAQTDALLYEATERVPVSGRKEGFEEIKTLFEKQRASGFFELAQDVWMASGWVKTEPGILKEVFASYLPEGCTVSSVRVLTDSTGKPCLRWLMCDFSAKSSHYCCRLGLCKYDSKVRTAFVTLSDDEKRRWQCSGKFFCIELYRGYVKLLRPRL